MLSLCALYANGTIAVAMSTQAEIVSPSRLVISMGLETKVTAADRITMIPITMAIRLPLPFTQTGQSAIEKIDNRSRKTVLTPVAEPARTIAIAEPAKSENATLRLFFDGLCSCRMIRLGPSGFKE